MKKLLLTLSLFFLFNSIYAQNPLAKFWDYRYGGTDFDVLSSLKQTTDGGYILGGRSQSGMSGDRSQPSQGGPDYWVVKIDSLGIKQWDKRFGGNGDDAFSVLQQTTDGGYILGGSSFSGVSGDKTQPNWDTIGFPPKYDYWIVKIDSLGIKQWDKRFGGTGNDWLSSIQQTNDRGFILGGTSVSGISGDKTQPSWGSDDYWIVKTDSMGVLQWNKRFGGTSGENLSSVLQTTDGGYILGGYSYSQMNGDKTQTNWSSGYPDYWIVKIDSLGIKQWDKRFGGTNDDYFYSMQHTADGGYVLGGNSNSAADGDKSQPAWSLVIPNYWIVKIDSLGIKQWDKRYGGTNGERYLGNLTQTSDNGYLMSGSSNSNISGDKSENNFIKPIANSQIWLVKTDSLGAKQWDKTVFTIYSEGRHCLSLQTNDGCYIIANYIYSGIGGYKTQTNWDTLSSTPDFWITKFCDCALSSLPNASIMVDKTDICINDCISFNDMSDCYTSRLWLFPGGNPSSSTLQDPNVCYPDTGIHFTYLISTNANGSDTAVLSMLVHLLPDTPTVTVHGDTLISSTSVSYQWWNGSVSTVGSSQQYIATYNDYYHVCIADSFGCTACCLPIYVNVTGISETEFSNNVKISPNPFTNVLNLKFNVAGEKLIILYDVAGKEILRQSTSEQEIKLNTEKLSAGFYLLNSNATNIKLVKF